MKLGPLLNLRGRLLEQLLCYDLPKDYTAYRRKKEEIFLVTKSIEKLLRA